MVPRNTGSAPPPADLSELRRELREAAEPERVPELQRFFKTGPGGYGEGDFFLGVRVPVVRVVARQHAGDMPRTMLRYAVERLDTSVRTELMAVGQRRRATVGDSDLGQNRRSPPSAR